MKKVAFTLASAVIFALFASCGSKPAPEETTPEAPVVQEEVTETEEIVSEEDTSSRDSILSKIEEVKGEISKNRSEEYKC